MTSSVNRTLPDKLEHRRIIRENELEAVLRFLPSNGSVLEIGAGAGWQSKALADHGYQVTAIDLARGNYSQMKVFPVLDYDGAHIPLPDASVDVIFSSNVLEHVPHIVSFQAEMQRVLKPGGRAIHVMPSATWRFWTTMTFYPERIAARMRLLIGQIYLPRVSETIAKAPEKQSTVTSFKGNKSLAKRLRSLFPSCHGERGSFVTEAYYFSRFYWQDLFRKTGWSVVGVYPNGLFYSGSRLFGSRLSLSARKSLSKVFGSSCLIYLMEKKQDAVL